MEPLQQYSINVSIFTNFFAAFVTFFAHCVYSQGRMRDRAEWAGLDGQYHSPNYFNV